MLVSGIIGFAQRIAMTEWNCQGARRTHFFSDVSQQLNRYR
jgi:hypothetical protein